MSEKIITFIGTGSMNGAIASGLLASGFPAEGLRATVNSAESAQKLSEKLGEGSSDVEVFSAEESSDANQKAVKGASAVLIGVKPYAVLEILESIKDALDEQTLVISVAAGVPLASMQKILGDQQPVIRCMPNTPSRVGKGVLAVSSGESVSEKQLELAEEILGAVGTVFRVEENQMDAVTAVSGSGPAYAFLLAECMEKAGIKLGLDEKTAQELAALTVAGAGALLERDPHPEDLRKAVTSPGGTTEQAIVAFQEGGIEELTYTAMKANADKSVAMSEEYSQ
ncbi:pyrroline-5-carboxylate reductase [uncultured Rothia sp.]|uniref:pyrroline-5-carboxylate reductase n=1 Tax=uncultured Rothia sp. TaxID=316088 RepID=UPI003216E911